MRANRRNYYRVLHVQPDAPQVVIRAAWRALMAMHHPDAGGDHGQAVLLNEAWETLGDPDRRAAYDATRTARDCCLFCTKPLVVAVGRQRPTHCPACRAPLERPGTGRGPAAAPGARPAGAGRPNGAGGGTAGGGTDRRGMARLARSDWGTLYLDPRTPGLDVRLRDLSPSGLSCWCAVPVAAGRRVRVVAPTCDLVGEVRTVRRSGAVHVLHLQLLTGEFREAPGGLVNRRA